MNLIDKANQLSSTSIQEEEVWSLGSSINISPDAITFNSGRVQLSNAQAAVRASQVAVESGSISSSVISTGVISANMISSDSISLPIFAPSFGVVDNAAARLNESERNTNNEIARLRSEITDLEQRLDSRVRLLETRMNLHGTN